MQKESKLLKKVMQRSQRKPGIEVISMHCFDKLALGTRAERLISSTYEENLPERHSVIVG